MKPYTKILLVAILWLLGTLGFAQSPNAVLTSGDIDNYIKTLTPMMVELQAIEDHYADEPEDANLWQYAEVRSILEKYGWDESYMVKWSAITLGATYLMMMEQLNQMPAEQAESMKALYVNQYKTLINDDDLKIIKPHLDELKKLFETMKEDE